MRALEPWHIIVLVVVLVLLFGSKRLPDAARGLGRSMRIFKSEMKEMSDSDPAPTPPDARSLGGTQPREVECRVAQEQAPEPNTQRREA